MQQRNCGSCSLWWRSAPPRMTVGCLRASVWLRSMPRYRLVANWFPAPDGGLPVRTWPGTIHVSRSRGNASVIILLIYYLIVVTDADTHGKLKGSRRQQPGLEVYNKIIK